MNTPTLHTERLVLRRFTGDDLPSLLAIYQDKEANTFLPWFPLTTLDEARARFTARYAAIYAQPMGFAWAICLASDNRPVGYVHIDAAEPHDLGYALRHELWHQGIVTEAARAAVTCTKAAGVPYVTATHDVNNPRSGAVMRNLGMCYRYSYEEQWQPKDLLVTFRLYQLNLDGAEERTYRGYWDKSAAHFVEGGL